MIDRLDSVRLPAPTPLRLAGIAAWIPLVALATVTSADSDLWGHLRFGLDMLETRGLTAVDPYSFTQDRQWINHEWLSELQMGLAFSLAGVTGLALLKGTLVASALWAVWRAMSGVRIEARMLLFAAVAAGTVPVTRTLRPQLWTLLFLAVLCTILAHRRAQARRWLPVLFVIWANCHGGWIVGFGVLLAWLTLESVEARRPSLAAVALAAACAIATFCNPYGWHLWTFLDSTVSLSGRAITEWQPLWRSPVSDSVPWIGALAAGGILLWRHPIPHRLQIAGVLAMLAYASLNVVRIVPLFVLATGVLLSVAFARVWPGAAATQTGRARGDMAFAAGLLAVAVVGASWILSSSLRCLRVDGPRVADATAAVWLKSARPGRLVTFFDWGQYALWHLGPDLRVSMDGRRETIYSDARLDEHRDILEGTPAGFRVLESWQPEYVWLPSTSAETRAWLVAQGYRLEHDSDESFVAVRPDLPPLRAGQVDPATFACFPG